MNLNCIGLILYLTLKVTFAKKLDLFLKSQSIFKMIHSAFLNHLILLPL